ncbi:hypothetical protein FVE85_8059 [Porphyridium purpureum]|uniref:Uncharacterized protein n=1 Tax=Porphyridium purpureum TaxID=35688 RepID=A0A5J4YNL4_PORPP|nr:hypothetical protein FVE85_8059 [Porphyridium purpureum]|eukprot:POR1014..scf295_9
MAMREGNGPPRRVHVFDGAPEDKMDAFRERILQNTRVERALFGDSPLARQRAIEQQLLEQYESELRDLYRQKNALEAQLGELDRPEPASGSCATERQHDTEHEKQTGKIGSPDEDGNIRMDSKVGEVNGASDEKEGDTGRKPDQGMKMDFG